MSKTVKYNDLIMLMMKENTREDGNYIQERPIYKEGSSIRYPCKQLGNLSEHAPDKPA